MTVEVKTVQNVEEIIEFYGPMVGSAAARLGPQLRKDADLNSVTDTLMVLVEETLTLFDVQAERVFSPVAVEEE